MSKFHYDSIKTLARENGLRVGDLLALAPANDPFYTGRPSEIEAAQWFADVFRQFGYFQSVHLRRIHYQIVSQEEPIHLPGGKGAYENTKRCWDYLNNAAKWARYLDLVPGEQFIDRRNPDAIIYHRVPQPDDWDYRDPTPRVTVNAPEEWEWEDFEAPQVPELPPLPYLPDVPGYAVDGYQGIRQPYLVEVWAEKTTMNDVLEPICERYSVNLVTGAGELSISAVLDFLERVEEAGRPARILYVSDFDPAGIGMPISVARKIEFYLRKGDYEADIRLEPIVLTTEQVEAYDLPRVPVKDSDRRKASWVHNHGAGQVELDALEALHPGALGVLIEGAIQRYYDPSLTLRAQNRRWELQDHVGKIELAIVEHSDDAAAIRQRMNDLVRSYEEASQR